ncbi:hypothetical protein ACIPVK_16175 [Paeniglutamicibacter sp. MACA_103]|uniref:hypothetical protein n=1 Tax=Paeniglutamicibacter sp. MACA_103 TaxID=3377337 RepID=UPI0038937E56
MQNKKWLAWALAVIVVFVGASIAFNAAARAPAAKVAGSDPSPSSTEQATAPTRSASESVSAPGSASAASTATSKNPSSAPPASSAKESKEPRSPRSSAPATEVESPKLEVPATTEPKATTLPKSVKKAPVLSGTVPREGTAKGELTSGFPTKAMPIPQGAHIIDSSVSTQKRNVQVAVNYRTSLSVEAVLKFYESQAAKRGWVATRGTAADGAKSISLGFGDDTMTATVRTAPTGATTVAAFGTYVVGK